MTVYAALGALAAALNLAGTIPYVRDIFRRKTKPQRSMWWIYSGLFAMLFWAQADAGSGWVLAVTAEYVATALLIAILSVTHGYGGFHKRDVMSIMVAILGLVLWQLTSQPVVAIGIVIVVDFVGFWLTLVKTWHAPHSETLISWQLSAASAFLSVFAADSLRLEVLAYPAYAVLATVLIVWLIIYRRRVVADDPADF